MKITVIGSGYVGLVTGVGLADSGNDVLCIDIDPEKIKTLKAGKSPIYEPGLEPLLQKNIKEKRIRFSTQLKEGIEFAEVLFIAVGTPPKEDFSADLSFVEGVAKDIGEALTDYKIIITKSTVPVKTGDRVEELIKQGLAKRSISVDFDVVSNPEFLKEGAAIQDFMYPDRIVIGTESQKAMQILKQLYLPFVESPSQIIFMDRLSAEMTKYAANSLLATKISFMNEIANLCEKTGADVLKVKQGIGSDPRIGPHFINAGIGYGGSCFPKDVKALIHTANLLGYDAQILKAVKSVNDKQRRIFFEKINTYFKGDLKDKTFALWGLAFKPETDDMREAPALEITQWLLEKGAKIKAFDPQAVTEAKKVLSHQIEFQEYNPYQVLEGAHALIILTEWKEFYNPDFKKMKKLMKKPLIFDGRNIFPKNYPTKQGFEYFSVGR